MEPCPPVMEERVLTAWPLAIVVVVLFIAAWLYHLPPILLLIAGIGAGLAILAALLEIV